MPESSCTRSGAEAALDQVFNDTGRATNAVRRGRVTSSYGTRIVTDANSGLKSLYVGGEADTSIVAGVGTAVYYERPGKWHYQSPSLAHKLETSQDVPYI